MPPTTQAINHVAILPRYIELIRGDVWRATFRVRPKLETDTWAGYSMALELYVSDAPVNIVNSTTFAPDGWVSSSIAANLTGPITWNEAVAVWVMTGPDGQPRSILRARILVRNRKGN